MCPDAATPGHGRSWSHGELAAALLEQLRTGVWVCTPDGVTTYVNEAAARLLGAEPEAVVGRSAAETLSSLGVSDPRGLLERILLRRGEGASDVYEFTVRRPDGSTSILQLIPRPVQLAGRTVASVVSLQDVTDIRRLEHERHAATEVYRRIVELADEAIWLTDAQDRVVLVNQRAADMLMLPAERIVGQNSFEVVRDFVDPEVLQEIGRKMVERKAGITDRYELRGKRPDGSYVYNVVAATPLYDAQGEYEGSLTLVTDVTTRKATEQLLMHRATHDQLTGLPNRRAALDVVSRLAARARTEGRAFAVLFCDIDRMRHINETWGHAVGDHVLMTLCRRVHDALRPGDTLARYDGDELVAVVDGLTTPDEPAALADAVMDAVRQPIEHDERSYLLTTSLGLVVVEPAAQWTGEQIIEYAAAAAARAKRRGGDRIERFDERLHVELTGQRDLEAALRVAIHRSELELHVQPIIDLTTGHVVAGEALVRWHHPTRGLLAASTFIDVAERSGLIVPIGEWVFGEAAAILARLDAELGTGTLRRLFVNVAARQLELNVADTVGSCLGSVGVRPDRMCIELTETEMFSDPALAAAALGKLKSLGCQLAVDDFGTGYSSLSRLTEFPIDIIKIDQTFVRDVGARPETTAIVAASVAMARALGRATVAEGVETAYELEFLRKAGCDLAQGYHLGRPAPVDALISRLKEERAARHSAR